MVSKKTQLVADFSLVFVTLVWGATFVTVKDAIEYIEPYSFLAIRFFLATIILLIICNKRILKISKETLGKGVIIGLVLFAGYAFQTFGLQYTTASNTGFITGLSVVIVPLILTFTTKKPPGMIPTLGIISATAGLGLLTVNNALGFNYGDFLVLFCAFSYALHILLLAKYSPNNDPLILATIQIGTVSAASFIAALLKEPVPSTEILLNQQVWQAILITAVLATALAFFIQTWMQKFTSPTHTAVIFTMEPVFAAIFAYWLGGEIFTLQQGLGAIFILTGMLIVALKDQHESTGNPVDVPVRS